MHFKCEALLAQKLHRQEAVLYLDIYKALKKEKSDQKKIYLVLIVISIILPIAVFLTGLTSTFYLMSLFILEILIFLSIISLLNGYRLKFSCANNKLRIQNGIFGTESLIFCDKVALVHTEKMEEDMEVIIITSVSFRNKNLKPVVRGFLKRYPKLENEYEKLRRNNENTIYYFQVIRRGGLNKYMLLDVIYKNCVRSVYTDECIQNIKIARGQTLV